MSIIHLLSAGRRRAIIADRKVMSAVEVARKHGVAVNKVKTIFARTADKGDVVLIGGMPEYQKDQIRADRQHMTCLEVARKHSISRQRVDQILREPPNENKRKVETEMGIGPENPSS